MHWITLLIECYKWVSGHKCFIYGFKHTFMLEASKMGGEKHICVRND